MKRMIKGFQLIALLLMLVASTTISAQQTFPYQGAVSHDGHQEHSRFFVGGAVTYWNDTEAKAQMFDFCPEFGYLFNDSWGIGMMLGLEYDKETKNNVQFSSHGLKLAPFARYYYHHRGPFNLYMDGGVALNWTSEKNHATQSTDRTNGFEIGIRPGACVDLTEGLCLCLRMGFIGYRNRFTMGEEQRIGHDGFGLRFAPEELMIGLELEF